MFNQQASGNCAERCEVFFVIFIYVAMGVGVAAVGGIEWLLLSVLAIAAVLGLTLLAEAVFERLSHFKENFHRSDE